MAKVSKVLLAILFSMSLGFSVAGGGERGTGVGDGIIAKPKPTTSVLPNIG